MRCTRELAIRVFWGITGQSAPTNHRSNPARATGAAVVHLSHPARHSHCGWCTERAECPAPGQPNDFTVTLNTEGAITLKWNATNAAASTGVYFNVRRKLAGAQAYETIGNTGSKSFVDDTLPFGTSSVTYIIQGYRGTQAGEASDQFVVQFGVGGNGFAEMKLAA